MIRLTLRHASTDLRPFHNKRFISNAVPIIDIGPFLEGTKSGKQKVAQEIDHTCSEIGFFAIKNHGISKEIIQNMLDSSKNFFDLPIKEKKIMALMSDDYPYGYNGLMEETLSSGKAHEVGKEIENLPDLKESFSMGPYNPKSGMAPPIFPKNPSNFSLSYMAYYKEMEKLSSSMARAFALALNLPENWFEDKTDRHRSVIRSINYPKDSCKPGQLRASAHTDYGTMTILLQDNTGGLQVLTKEGKWQDIAPVEDTFVVNIGDLMARWTNDRWVSTLHRVVDPSVISRRQSVAFFQNINADHLVTCIDTCMSSSNPPKYPPIIAFDHLMEKHLASFKPVEVVNG